MPGHQARSRRSLVTSAVILFVLIIFLLSASRSRSTSPLSSRNPLSGLNVQASMLKGHSIMPALGNETAKAELGRAAWKLLHTTMARFPDEPTTDESAALEAYIHLFQRLYPCGECSKHFRKILDKYPPQVASRSTAAAWACHVHNQVNRSLKKPEWDCSNIGDFYDCGCAEDKEGDKAKKKDKAGGRGGDKLQVAKIEKSEKVIAA